MKKTTSLTLGLLVTFVLEGQAGSLPVAEMSDATRPAVVTPALAPARPGALTIVSPAGAWRSRPAATTVRVPLPASFYFFLSGLLSFVVVLRRQRQRYAGAPPATSAD